jgi:non-specific serine/threonine protein kinase/serine/threonine-protein kinase
VSEESELDGLRAARRLFEEVVDLPERERAGRIAELSDPGLVARLERLLAADRVPESALGAPLHAAVDWLTGDELAAGLASDRHGERIGAWRILERLGRGGMGEVFLAERADGAFERRVALKLLKRGLDSEEIVARFLGERRILSRLDHPGIAQLVDGGLAGDGRPFFALELVLGRPITDWCAEQRLPLEARLRLLQDVVAAVDFAHRNLVVHRDLKPSNVLVTAEGTVKLLDFGIAKLIGGEDEAATRTGARLLTPRYAAPEQLAGEPVTTATDVYALGLLLWELATGEPARRTSTGGALPSAADLERETRAPPSARVLAAEDLGRAPVEDDSPRARRRLARRLAGDLDNVALKALRREPERRYTSAAAFGDDLGRFLDERPVAARGGALAYRAGKFARRHRAAVIAAGLIAVSLAAGVAATWRETRIAEAERARADRRFADVRRLANVALFDVHAALDNVAGGMAARRLLVATALDYLDDLAREAGDEPELLAELATAYERTAEVQGMPGWPSEGRTGDALASLERALELRRRSHSLAPANAAAELTEARLLVRLGTVLAARGATRIALVRHLEALAIYRAAQAQRAGAGSEAATTGERLELAQALIAVGDDLWELGDVPAAAARYRDALAAAAAVRAADPGSPLAIRQVGVAEQRLGDAAAEAGDWPRALAHHGASLAVDRELASRARDDAEVRRDLGTDLSRLGADYAAQGRAAEALAQHRAAVELREALLDSEPEDARALEDAAESRLHAGKALLALGRRREAVDEISVAIERWRNLAGRDGGNARWQDVLAGALTTLAEAEHARGGFTAAARAREEALALRRRLAATSPDFAENRAALAALESSPAR